MEIVGREAELTALAGVLDREAASRAVVLLGEPGIGKTTLWEAGIAAARERGALVLSARPAPAEVARLELGGLSFGPVWSLLSRRLGSRLTRRVLRQVFESSGGNPLFALELGRLLAERGEPEVGQELPVPGLVNDLVGARVA